VLPVVRIVGLSEAEMRERFVGFCHTVNFFALFDRAATASRIAIDFSLRLRAASRSQRIASALRRD